MISPLQLVNELWENSDASQRCPYVSHDGERCRCSAVAEYNSATVCDSGSLQLWCLDGKERHEQCIFYPKNVGGHS